MPDTACVPSISEAISDAKAQERVVGVLFELGEEGFECPLTLSDRGELLQKR